MKSFLVIFLTFVVCQNCSGLDVEYLVNYAATQYTKLSATIPPTGAFISTGDPTSLTWRTTDRSEWTCGFYAGSLWMLYKLTNDSHWRSLAEANQDGLFSNQFEREHHDVGFIIMSSFGHALELTGDKKYEDIISQAGISLAGRFFRLAGLIRSWNSNPDSREVQVIVDNMMNLELLFKASEFTRDDYFRQLAISHANNTLTHFFRPDGSSYHVVAFHEENGHVKRKYTAQGYADDSTWSRGQAWAIHGFTTTYKYTSDPSYLEIAEKAASYFINHLHPDYIPIWDFNSPFETSYQPRDTSAGAIAACAFLELYTITGKREYFDVAERMLEGAASSDYLSNGSPQYLIPSILVNGTVFYNQGDFNTAITYADYYFLRALDMYRGIQEKF